MSAEAMAIAMNHSRAKGSARAVLNGIANHDGDGGAWPSNATLATYGGVDERQARRLVDQLVSLGEISKHVQAGGTAWTEDHDRPNLYHFLLTCPPHCDGSRSHRLICEACGKRIPGTIAAQTDRLHRHCRAVADRGVQGPSPRGVQGPSPRGVQGPSPRGVQGPSPRGVQGPSPRGVQGPGEGAQTPRTTPPETVEQSRHLPERARANAPAFSDAARLDWDTPANAAVQPSAVALAPSPAPASPAVAADPERCQGHRFMPHSWRADGTCAVCSATRPEQPAPDAFEYDPETGEIR